MNQSEYQNQEINRAYKQGFTLIELLVVIAIIGILAALVVTQLGTARTKARNASAKSDITEAGKAIESFKSDDLNTGSYPIAAVTVYTTTSPYGGDTLNSSGTATGSFVDFTTGGTQTITTTAGGDRYPLKLIQSQGTNQTYHYATNTTNAAPGNLATTAGYTVWTTLDTADPSVGSNIIFQDNKGNTGLAGTPTAP